MPSKFSSQTSADTPTLGVEFTAALGTRTIASCEVTVEMFDGSNENDPDPSSTLDGEAVTNAEEFVLHTSTGDITVPAHCAVLQPILSGRVLGATYLYRFSAIASDGKSLPQEDVVQTITKYSEP